MTTQQDKHLRHITPPEDRVPVQQLLAFGVGGVVSVALFNIAGQLMGLIGNISLGLSAFWLGVIMIIPRLWDAFSDPIVGHFSDNTRTRWGRRRPYLLFGGIAVAFSFVLMWWIPQGELVRSWFPSENAFQWFQLCYILLWLLIFFTACTLFEIPHGALGMEMSPDYHERTRLFSAKSFFGNLFAMGTPWLFALANLEIFKGVGGNEVDGMRYVSMIIAVLLIPLSFWWFSTLKEPGFAAAKTREKASFWRDMKCTASNKTFLNLVAIIFTLAMGFNFVSLFNYYIPIFYLFGGDKVAASAILGINGTVWAITGVFAVFPLNYMSYRLGKRTTLLIAIALMCLAQLTKIFCYNPEYPYLIIIPTILLSCGMLFFFTLGSAMVGDICDEDDLKTGSRREGSYYSVYWWFIKTGTAFASLVTGVLILFTLFDETQVKKVDELQGSIRQAYSQLDVWDKSQKAAVEPDKSTERVQQTGSAILTAQHQGVHLALEKARIKSYELLQHLQMRSQQRQHSAEHYADLLQNARLVSRDLLSMTEQLNQELLDPEASKSALRSIEQVAATLTLQSPRTLLWMRAFEIILPILLCIISGFLAFRYSLSEAYCYEIKAKLKERNERIQHNVV